MTDIYCAGCQTELHLCDGCDREIDRDKHIICFEGYHLCHKKGCYLKFVLGHYKDFKMRVVV
jgi:hypothetical protein